MTSLAFGPVASNLGYFSVHRTIRNTINQLATA
jgi:hypothetical protein